MPKKIKKAVSFYERRVNNIMKGGKKKKAGLTP